MRQFINGSDAAFADLRLKARRACFCCRNQELPPGAIPRTSRVAFQIDPRTGRATLFVDRARYNGRNATVARWLRDGVIVFSDFESLRRWIQGELAAVYASSSRAPSAALPSDLTDLGAVLQSADSQPEDERCIYVDEESLFRKLTTRVRGQEVALRQISKRVAYFLAKKRHRRPLSIVFCGQTGIGKTLAAESLHEVLGELVPNNGFGYLRIDSNELKEAHRASSSLLGAPPGYVGHGDGAILVNKLSQNPKTIVLFDEFEKAHADIQSVLMNTIDCGRLSSAPGRREAGGIACHRSIFFFTSNLESHSILAEIRDRNMFGDPDAIDRVCRERFVAGGMLEAVVGRMNCFVAFVPLALETRAEICTLAIRKAAEDYGIRLVKIAPQAVLHLLEKTKAVEFGARPYEQKAEEYFAAAFAEAAGSRHTGPFELTCGPPFKCVPIKIQSQGLMI